jgi:stage II sporulation protein D
LSHFGQKISSQQNIGGISMKVKSTAILLVVILLLAGCRQPIKTPPPSTQASPSPSATAVAQVPKLPDRFTGQSSADIKLKVYDIKTKSISQVNMNEYLYGVLAGEMRQDWPAEALKAQAIIARTFLLQYLTENKASKVSPDADISTDPEESQAYDASGINDNIKKAVNDTDGVVIAYNGQFIHAWFHSASGGKTADAVEGLDYKDGNPPYIQSVTSDESSAPKEFTEWQNTFTTDEISAGLSKLSLGIEGDISSIKLGKTGPSGRATTIVINGQDVPAASLRTAMDPVKFRSTFITELKFDGSKLTISGKGFGHGVGMPQWGAFQMASNGKKAEDIINYYFKGVSIVNLWKK